MSDILHAANELKPRIDAVTAAVVANTTATTPPTAAAIATAIDDKNRASPLVVSGAVTAASLPLPSGAATSADLTTSFTRADAYTGAATGTAVNLGRAMSKFSILCKGTGGTPTIWDIRLEGSIDGVTYGSIIQHSNADGDGAIKGSATVPAKYIRSRSTGAITLGAASDMVATILAMP